MTDIDDCDDSVLNQKLDAHIKSLDAEVGTVEILSKKVHELEAQLATVWANRGGRMLLEGKTFISIRDDEPYYFHVYQLIRKHEKAKGRWTEEDEVEYQRQLGISRAFDSLQYELDAAIGRALGWVMQGDYPFELVFDPDGFPDDNVWKVVHHFHPGSQEYCHYGKTLAEALANAGMMEESAK